MSLLTDWRHRPTQRRVWALALPMLASNITVPLVALADTIVAGHLSQAADLAAVAIGGIIFQVPVWVFGFLRMGTVGFAAQAVGAGDGAALRGLLLRALLLAVGLGMTALALILAGMGPVLELLDASAATARLARVYLDIRLLSLPVVLANYALMGWFLGAQDARTPMAMLIVTNLVNIALNLLFVFAFGWGVAGIALASVLGALCGLVIGLGRLPAMLARHPGIWPGRRLWVWQGWRKLMAVNRDIMLRSIALQGVFFAMTTLGARLGDTVVAANALLLNGLLLTSFALDGLANAIEALAGHAVGARDRTALRRAVVVCGGWSFVIAAGFALAFLVGGELFIDLQTSIDAVRATARPFLSWLVALPLVAVWGYLLDGLFIGTTRAREMRNAMLVATAGFALLAWLLHPFGNHGLWLAFLAFTAVRGAIMAWLAVAIAHRDGWVEYCT